MRTSFLIALTVCAIAGPACAQWYVGLEWATHTYRGSSHDTSGTHVASEGRPAGGAVVGVRFGRGGRPIGYALRLTYANAGFAVAGQGITVMDKTTGTLLELASLLNTRVGGVGPSGAIRAEFGPTLHLWNFDGEIRPRLGLLGAASYEWPVVGRLSGAIRLEGILSKSWFDAADLPPEFERQVTWRYGVGVGLRYRL